LWRFNNQSKLHRYGRTLHLLVKPISETQNHHKHCLSDFSYDASSLTIRAGSSTRGVGGQVINVSKIYNNPDFSEQTIDSDISVLELSANLTFDLTWLL
jgi:hypothetical protein